MVCDVSSVAATWAGWQGSLSETCSSRDLLKRDVSNLDASPTKAPLPMPLAHLLRLILLALHFPLQPYPLSFTCRSLQDSSR